MGKQSDEKTDYFKDEIEASVTFSRGHFSVDLLSAGDFECFDYNIEEHVACVYDFVVFQLGFDTLFCL